MPDSIDLESGLPANELSTEENADPLYSDLKDVLWSLSKEKVVIEENLKIIRLHSEPMVLSLALKLLHKAGILTQENFEGVRSHLDPQAITLILHFLQEAGILTQENLAGILLHQESEHIALSLSYLQKTGILTQKNFEVVLSHKEPKYIGWSLRSLQEAGILTQENLTGVLSHQEPKEIEQTLSSAGTLIQENFEVIKLRRDPIYIALSLSYLQETGLLIQKNFEAVLSHQEPFYIRRLLSTLKETGILTQENFAGVLSHQKPKEIEQSLSSLKGGGILTQENFEGVLSHLGLETVNRILKLVQETELLTQQNYESIVLCSNPSDIEQSFNSLQKAGILTQENFKHLLSCPDKYFSVILKFLLETGMLTQENFGHIRQYQNTNYIMLSLNFLKKAEILTQENFVCVISHPEPKAVSVMLGLMQVVGILNQQNLEGVLAHTEPMYIGVSIIFIEGAGILTQQNFEVILSPSKPNIVKLLLTLSLLQALVLELNLEVGDMEMLTQEKFETIWLHSESNNIASSLEDFQAAEIENQENFSLLIERGNILMDEIVESLFMYLSLELITGVFQRFREANQAANVNNLSTISYINDKQSTHTTSVHQSVSESATRLLTRYSSKIQDSNLDITIGRLINFINGLSDNSEKNKAAKRCILRITAIDYTFIDNISGVSLKQLLALTYLAVLNDNSRCGTLQDAEEQLIEGLYEIQCGYNLSETGKYLGGEDDPICARGAFNKLIEKLQGIHPDCGIRFMTSVTVSLKLPIVVKEAALEYLSSLASPITTEEFLEFTHLMQKIKEHGIEVIWNQIKDPVADRLFNEFSHLYEYRENKSFLNLIKTGRYTTLSDNTLNVFQERIQNSKGYYRYCNALLRHNGLFYASHRQDKDIYINDNLPGKVYGLK